MKKSKSSLKRRISMIYISLIFIIVALGAISIYSLSNISAYVGSLITTNYNSIERIAEMDAALKEQRQDMLLYIYSSEEDNSIESFQKHYDTFMSYYEKEYGTIVIPEEMSFIVQIKNEYDEFAEMFQILQTFDTSNPNSDQFEKALIYYEKTILPQYDKTLSELKKLKTSNETALFARRDDTYSIIQNTTYLLCFLFIFTAITSFVTFRYYINKLFGPLYELTQNLKSVRQGNLNRKVIIQDTDELGSLCNEFNNMTQRLSEFEKSTLGSLMEEKNKTYAIVKSITEPMLILDANYNVTLMNDSFERLLFSPISENVNAHFLDAMAQSCFSSAAAKINYRAAEYWNGVIKINHNWKPAYYNVMVSPISQNGNGQNKFVIIVFYDITEMKLLEKMRTDFIATISHEFKTPLTSIIIGADLLGNCSIGQMNKEQREILETIKDDSQQLNVLVNDLLELSKAESSNIIYQFKFISIESALEKCTKQFLPRAKNLGVDIEIVPYENLPKVYADFSKIVWVLNNLVSNALKYTSSNGKIKLSAMPLNNFIKICVEDNGKGIPDEFVEKIFDKYVQVPGCDIETRGTGLGLAVAKDIITAHKGRIWCESDISKGSRFYFTLPINDIKFI